MNPEQLNAIEERVVKATPGPWIVEESRYEGRFNAASVDENYDLPACLMGIEDAEFVTHAREDVPALIAEVERLHEVIKGATVVSNQAKGLVKENKRLREALTQILEYNTFDLAKFETEVIEIARKALKDGD
ncbi:hypothetical protein [Bacillus phage SDFMU_Pfc]|nr:hypothetical protein [Bacillus phage SDFMU_Pfc]